MAWPSEDQRNSCPAFEVAVLAAAKRSGRFMGAQFRDGIILIAVVNNGTVVARKDHQRVSGQIQSIEGPENLSRRPVSLDDGVAAGTHGRLPCEARMWNAPDARIGRGQIQKERPAAARLDERH